MQPLSVTVGAGGALLALFGTLRRLRRDRLLADTTAVRIRSAAQGYVKVRGRAAPAHPEPTRAPLSGRPCVWWSYEIDSDESEQRGKSDWHTQEQATSVELFMLIDEDEARCLVGPVGAEITPTTCSVWYGEESIPGGPPPPVPPPVRLGRWRYTERLLDIGARLSVLGELRSHSEVGDVNRVTQEKLRLWKQDQAGLLARFDAQPRRAHRRPGVGGGAQRRRPGGAGAGAVGGRCARERHRAADERRTLPDRASERRTTRAPGKDLRRAVLRTRHHRGDPVRLGT